MPLKWNAPAVRTGASPCEKLAGGSRPLSTVEAYQAQFVSLSCGVRPEWAAMVAALAFGGSNHG